MNNIVSNSDIINMFKEVDELEKNSNLPEEKLKTIIIQKQNDIIRKLSFLVFNNVKIYKKFPNYDDLIQEGFIGLTKAVRKFKWQKFPNFFIFSSQWIRHYVKRAASRYDIVYNPNRNRVIYAEPDDTEIDTDDTPDEVLFAKERQRNIIKILNEFPKRDREIVQKIFGMNGNNEQTLREVGPQFELSYERIRQIKSSVIDKLRKNHEINELNQ